MNIPAAITLAAVQSPPIGRAQQSTPTSHPLQQSFHSKQHNGLRQSKVRSHLPCDVYGTDTGQPTMCPYLAHALCQLEVLFVYHVGWPLWLMITRVHSCKGNAPGLKNTIQPIQPLAKTPGIKCVRQLQHQKSQHEHTASLKIQCLASSVK